MTLLARVDLMEDELTQASFLERLATVSGCPSAASFCRDFGLSFSKIRRGDREQLLCLSEIAGADPSVVLANAVIEVAPRSFEIRGCRVISNMLRTDEVALCPACVKADLERGACRRNPYDNVYLRIPWHLRAIETCSVHSCRLERFELKNTKYQKRSFTVFGWDAAYQLQSGFRQQIPQQARGLEVYLHGRLNGSTSGTWLDDMPLSEVTRLCEGFGERIADDEGLEKRPAPKSSSPRELREEGFRLLNGGPQAVQEFLTASLAACRKRYRVVGIKHLLGQTLTVLLTRRDEATTDFRLFRQEC